MRLLFESLIVSRKKNFFLYVRGFNCSIDPVEGFFFGKERNLKELKEAASINQIIPEEEPSENSSLNGSRDKPGDEPSEGNRVRSRDSSQCPS